MGSWQTFEAGYLLKTRNMAISAAMVLPDPVGAPRRTFVSVWYSVWNIWVWMGLKWVKLYRFSNSRFPRDVTGKGCRSRSSERENGDMSEKMGEDSFIWGTSKMNINVHQGFLCLRPFVWSCFIRGHFVWCLMV